jgi:hypothetical protein
MWEEEIENLIRDRLDTSSTMTVAIVRGKRQLKLSRRGEHSGVATVNFANGGLSAAAEKLAAGYRGSQRLRHRRCAFWVGFPLLHLDLSD